MIVVEGDFNGIVFCRFYVGSCHRRLIDNGICVCVCEVILVDYVLAWGLN